MGFGFWVTGGGGRGPLRASGCQRHFARFPLRFLQRDFAPDRVLRAQGAEHAPCTCAVLLSPVAAARFRVEGSGFSVYGLEGLRFPWALWSQFDDAGAVSLPGGKTWSTFA